MNRGPVRYLRCRRVPVALAAAVAGTTVMWLLPVVATGEPAGPVAVVLTVLLLTTILAGTLGGPDDTLERTAALAWAPRRVAHLLAGLAVVAGLPAATLLTGSGLGPAGLVLRDAAGLVGLTALAAVLLGAARAWFLPLGWTLAAVVHPLGGSALGEALTWQGQPPGSTPAALVAAVLAVSGVAAYALAGPALRPPAEAAL
ncbi:hypothetical protein [Blastococcus sp. SYSU D00695]